jgi:hypothetical protein
MISRLAPPVGAVNLLANLVEREPAQSVSQGAIVAVIGLSVGALAPRE